MIQRQSHNCITRLSNEEGRIFTKQEDIVEELVAYNNNILKEYGTGRMKEIESILQHIQKLVSNEQNESLMQPITLEEAT